MTGSQPEDGTPAGAGEPLNSAERAVDELLDAAHLLAAHQLPELLAAHGRRLGVEGATLYLADLQQDVLVPFVGPAGPGLGQSLGPVAVEATLAGRAYQQVQVLTQDLPGGQVRVWLPLLDGSERLGVLSVVAGKEAMAHPQLLARLRRFAALAAELVMTKTMYGDTLVQLRRSRQMGLAAELQWSLLPPLTFACDRLTIAAALEPAYEVAGDTVDYAVDAGRARLAVFDGMGHGLHSAQLAALTVAAYRNARRSGRSLAETARTLDEALLAGFGGEAFTTAVLAELDTDTGRLEWVSAGHTEPLLLRGGRLVKTLHVDPAPPLGLVTARTPPARPIWSRSAASSSNPATGCWRTGGDDRAVPGQAGQDTGGDGVELAHVPEAERTQERAQRRGRPHPVEQPTHPAMTQQLRIGDRVRTGNHARDQRGHLRPDRSTGATRSRQMPIGERVQPRPLRQRQCWHQPGARHETRIIETRRAHRIGMGKLHLRDTLVTSRIVP